MAKQQVKTNAMRILESLGIPYEHFGYEAEQMDLKPGTRLIAYTDGVTEAEKRDQSLYGDERLMERNGAPTSQTTSARILHGDVIPVSPDESPYITMSKDRSANPCST